MKRIIPIVFLLLVTLCSCEQHNEVPDMYIRWEVEDYLTSKSILPSEYTDYTIKTTHFPDSSTNTDSVHLTLIVNCPYGTYSVESQQVYQYSKKDDTWSVLRNNGWSNETYTFDESAFCKTWSGGGNYGSGELGNTYEIYIDDIDFSNKTVSCSYSFNTNIYDDYHVETVYYSGTGTFDFSNGLRIVEDKVTYNVSFSIWTGISVYADSGIFRNE